MSKEEKPGSTYDFSGMAVFDRLDKARKQMEDVKGGPAPQTGYLDTQLFPEKKDINPNAKSNRSTKTDKKDQA